MMRLSRASEYAIRGVIYLSKLPHGTVCYSSEVSEAQGIPRSFLPKIFQTLTRKGIVKSLRGARGGFSLGRLPEEITLFDVIEAVDGPTLTDECLIQKGVCHQEQKCPMHNIWYDIQAEFWKRAKENNFKKLIENENALELALTGTEIG